MKREGTVGQIADAHIDADDVEAIFGFLNRGSWDIDFGGCGFMVLEW